MQIYGEAFIEIIYKKKGSIPATDLKSIKEKDRFKKEISGIRVINPKNMLIVRDSLGKYIKYKTDEGIKTIAYAQVAYDIATTFGHVLSSPEDIKKLTEAYYTVLKEISNRGNIPIISDIHEKIAGVVYSNGGVYKPSGAGGGDIGIAFSDSKETIENVKHRLALNHIKTLDLKITNKGFHFS